MMLLEAISRFRQCLFLVYVSFGLLSLLSHAPLTTALFTPMTPNLYMRRHPLDARSSPLYSYLSPPLLACVPLSLPLSMSNSIPFSVIPPLAYDFPLRQSHAAGAGSLTNSTFQKAVSRLTRFKESMYRPRHHPHPPAYRERSWRVPTRTDGNDIDQNHKTYARSKSPGNMSRTVEIPDVWMFN